MGCSWNRCAHILEAMIFVCEAHAERSVLTRTGIGKTSAKRTFEKPCDLPFVWNSGGTSMAERAILCCDCQNHLWRRQQLPNVFSRWNSCGKKHANPKSKWAKHDWLDANALDLWLDQNWNTPICNWNLTFSAVHRIKDMNQVQVQVERIPSRKGGGLSVRWFGRYGQCSAQIPNRLPNGYPGYLAATLPSKHTPNQNLAHWKTCHSFWDGITLVLCFTSPVSDKWHTVL